MTTLEEASAALRRCEERERKCKQTLKEAEQAVRDARDATTKAWLFYQDLLLLARKGKYRTLDALGIERR